MDDFSQLQLGGQPHEQWAQDFAIQQQNGRARSWNQIWDESKGQTNEWATQFDQSQSASVRGFTQTLAFSALAADVPGAFASTGCRHGLAHRHTLNLASMCT